MNYLAGPGLKFGLSIVISAIFAGVLVLQSRAHAGDQISKPGGSRQPENAAEPLTEICDKDDMGRWLTYYYLSPTPELTPDVIQEMSRQGIFAKEHAAAPMAAFFARIFAANPDKLAKWAPRFKAMKADEKRVICYALYFSNTDEGKKLCAELVKNLPDADKWNNLLSVEPVPFEEMTISGPDVLDALWGSFMATGDSKYVERVMTALPLLEKNRKQLASKAKRVDVMPMVLGGAARWSLTSNCRQHERVMKICKAARNKHPELKTYLDDIVSRAEE